MTHNTTAQPNAAQMLHEAQGYRTSLEALMSVGRTLLLNPSMESDSADSFKVLAEGVLEQADHQADLQVVDGVTEPQAQVELIMQDVLTPRLTEVEQIEEALQNKADSEEPVPFTTRDTETSASLESAFRAEALGLFQENIQAVRTVISMEGMTVDAVRPLVLNVARRVGGGLVDMGVSMEDLEQTQVLGEMADAVERIENLVNTAREAADESAEAARSEAQAIGADETDKMGDLIEQHRQDNPSGVKLNEGVSATTIESDTPQSAPNLDGGDPVVREEGIEASNINEGEGTGDAGDGTDLSETGGETTDLDDTGLEEPVVDENAEVTEEITGEEGGEATDPVDEPVVDEATDVEAEIDAANSEEDVAAAEAEATETEEDEEEEEGKPSTESAVDVMVIEDISARGDDKQAVIDISVQLMNWLDSNGLLTSEGQAVQEAGVDEGFKLDTSMVVTAAGDVLVKHYPTWIAGCIRDGETNTRALQVLMGI